MVTPIIDLITRYKIYASSNLPLMRKWREAAEMAEEAAEMAKECGKGGNVERSWKRRKVVEMAEGRGNGQRSWKWRKVMDLECAGIPLFVCKQYEYYFTVHSAHPPDPPGDAHILGCAHPGCAHPLLLRLRFSEVS